MTDLVAIAKTIKTRGLRGELVAEILTDFPERFEKTKTVFALKPGANPLELNLASFWFQKNRVILKFENFDSIEAAETLINSEICIPESEAIELEADEYFDWELEGCTIETLDGTLLGKVREVMRTGGTEVLVVDDASDDEKDFLIPFATAICLEVDVKNKVIRVDLPEGLLEF